MKTEQQKEYKKKWVKQNPELVKLQNKRYYSKTVEQQRKYSAEYRKNNYEKVRASRLKKYGLTIELYEAILKSQGHVCAICKQSECAPYKAGSAPKSLAVDHCHKTGKIRGLLCMNCNKALGHLKDNIDLMHNAINYIKRSSYRD